MSTSSVQSSFILTLQTSYLKSLPSISVYKIIKGEKNCIDIENSDRKKLLDKVVDGLYRLGPGAIACPCGYETLSKNEMHCHLNMTHIGFVGEFICKVDSCRAVCLTQSKLNGHISKEHPELKEKKKPPISKVQKVSKKIPAKTRSNAPLFDLTNRAALEVSQIKTLSESTKVWVNKHGSLSDKIAADILRQMASTLPA